MKKISAVSILIFSILSCSELDDDYKQKLEKNITGVTLEDFLFVREKPDADSESKGVIRFNSVVDIIDVSRRRDTVKGLTAFWYKIKVEQDTGWVFGSYVSIDAPYAFRIKDFPVKQWKSIIGKDEKFTKGRRFIETDYRIPLYRTTHDIVMNKSFTKMSGNEFIEVIEEFYDDNQYETGLHFRIKHKVYGDVWLCANYVNIVGDVKKFDDYTVVLCSTEPVIEGDMNNYDVIVYKGERIVAAIKDFMDVGPYATAEIIRIYSEKDIMHIELFCDGENGDRCPFSSEKVDRIEHMVFVLFNTKNGKIERAYRYSW